MDKIIYCSHCGSGNKKQAKFCGNCGKPIFGVVTSNINRKNKILIFLLLAAIILSLGLVFLIGYDYFKGHYLYSTNIPQYSLANIDFPKTELSYPLDWPAEIIFPNQFSLVDTSFGIAPSGSAKSWVQKLRFTGTTSEAGNSIMEMLNNNGWIIIINEMIDTKRFSILIQRDQDNGIVIIDADPDDASKSLIMATISLQ